MQRRVGFVCVCVCVCVCFFCRQQEVFYLQQEVPLPIEWEGILGHRSVCTIVARSSTETIPVWKGRGELGVED